jgi:hypothetical protein
VTELPFAIDGQGVLEAAPRARFEEGAVFGVAADAVALLTVAWLDEPPDARLEDAVEEDLRRTLSRPGVLLVDLQAATLGGVESVRSFVLDVGEGVPATASEQWRLLAAGRRWTVSAVTALPDQPVWGPRLAEIAATFRAR